VCAWVANSHRVLQTFSIDSASESAITVRDTVADGSTGSDLQWMIRADQIMLQCGGEIFPAPYFKGLIGRLYRGRGQSGKKMKENLIDIVYRQCNLAANGVISASIKGFPEWGHSGALEAPYGCF